MSIDTQPTPPTNHTDTHRTPHNLPKPIKHLLTRLLPAIALAATTSSASAVEVAWTNYLGGWWSQSPSNWSNGGAPFGLKVVFDLNSPAPGYPVWMNANPSTHRLSVRNDTVTLFLLSNTYNISGIGSDIRVGESSGDNANLTLNGPGQVRNLYSSAYIGYAAGATGSLTLNGATLSMLSGSFGNMFVGNLGDGTLTINPDATVSNLHGNLGTQAGSTGTAVVNGGTWTHSGSFAVGNHGSGQLTIQSGGTVSNAIGYIGLNATSDGTVTVTDPGSTWTNASNLDIGQSGTGQLTISNGGAVTVLGSTILRPTGNIDLSNGSLTTSTLDTTPGGTFNWPAGNLGITGPSGMLFGTGGGINRPLGSTLTIDPAKTLDVTNTTTIESTGSLTLDGGTLRTGTLDHTAGGTFDWISGELGITGPAGLPLGTGGGIDRPLGSTLTLDPAKTLDVTNTTTIESTGSLTLDGGTLQTAALNNTSGGTLNWNSGTLALNHLQLDNGVSIHRPFGTTLAVSPGRTLQVAGDTTVGLFGILAVNGGHLRTGRLVNFSEGLFSWPSGTIAITGGAGLALGTTIDVNHPFYNFVGLGPSKALEVTNTTTIESTGNLTVNGGQFHTGALNNSAGGTLNWFSGTIGITGTQGLFIGPIGGIDRPFSNDLTIGTGKTLEVTATTTIEEDGAINLSGGTFSTGALIRNPASVFNFTSGTLNITNSNFFIQDGQPLGATATIGSDSQLNVAGFLHVPFNTMGALTIQGGGQVTAASNVPIGNQLGANGSVTVNGPGSQLTGNGPLMHVGFLGTGELNATDGALVQAAGDLNIATRPGSTGTVTVGDNNATITTGDDLNLGGQDTAAGGTATLNINPGGQVTVGDLLFIHPQGTLNLQGGTLNTPFISSPSGTTNFTSGTLNITAGSLLIQSGQPFGASPTIGAGQQLNVAGFLHVPFNTTGDLTITDGGQVTADGNVPIGNQIGANGSITVTGTGSQLTANGPLMHVGFLGNGTLTVEDAASVHAAGDLNIATHSLSTASMTIADPGTTVTVGDDLNVGGDDTAPGGTATLTLNPGATLNVTDTLRMRNSTVTVTDGATLTADQLQLTGGHLTTPDLTGINTFNFNHGTLSVTGVPGLTLAPTAPLGPTTTLDSSKTLNVTNTTTINDGATFTLAGGTWTTGDANNAGHLAVLANPTVDFGTGLTNTGDLVLANTTATGPVTSPAGSSITIIGTVNFNDLVSGAAGFFGPGTAVFNAGHNPGDSPAAVNIEGNLTYTPTNTLFIELAGTTPGTQHDQLNISGGVTLDGTLDIQRLDDYTPTLGDTFTILTYNTRTPDSFFDTITNTHMPGDTTLALAPLLNEVTKELTLRATIPGDLNLDNKVSVADLAEFALNFGTTPGLYNETDSTNSWLLGDFNTDGAITVADLSLLALNFGFTLLPDGTTTPSTGLTPEDLTAFPGLTDIDTTSRPAIPEPATLSIFLLTALTKRPRNYRSRYNNLLTSCRTAP